jgi:hypothetical protein
VTTSVVAQTQHTDRDFWWVCREEEREQSRKRWWDPRPLSLVRTRVELPQTEERKRESRAGSGGGTQGRSLSHAPVAHVHDVDDGSGIISDSEPVREFGPCLIIFLNMFLFRTQKKLLQRSRACFLPFAFAPVLHLHVVVL